MNKYLRKTISLIRWTLATLLIVLLLLVIGVHIPAVQNFAKAKIVSYLETKIKTKVVVAKLEFGILKQIKLEGVYFEDQKKDTLLSGKLLAVDISLLQLVNNKIQINSIALEGITSYLNRDKKGIFNFDYLTKAFATPDDPKDTSTPMVLSIDKIDLNQIKINYNDALSHNEASVVLKHFDTRIKTFDLDAMSFDVPKFKINGLQLKIKQGLLTKAVTATQQSQSKTATPDLKLKLGEIELKKIALVYADENSKITSNLSLQKLLVSVNLIDLSNQLLLLNAIAIQNVKGTLTLGKMKQIITQKETTNPLNTNKWEVKINETHLKKINFKFDDNNAVALKKGMDYSHLQLQNAALEATNIQYSPESVAATVHSFSAKEQSGLHIQAFKTDFFFGNKIAFLKNLYLKTPQTILRNEFIVTYPSVASITKNSGEVALKATLKQSQLGFKDILIFMPTLAATNSFKSNPNAILKINSTVSGKLKNIEIPNLEISGIGKTKLKASGKIVGLPDVKTANFDLVIHDFQSGATDINQFVPKGTIPNSIALPSQLTAKGTFKGTVNHFYTNMNLGSSWGAAKIKASFDQRQKNKEKYEAQTEFQNFDLGKFIKNNAVGKISLKATVKGTGMNPKTANAMVSGTIFKANVNNYTYQNATLKGRINAGNYTVSAVAKDPNLTFDATANGGFKDKYPTGKVALNVDIADLDKLNLHAGPMKLRGNLYADIQSLDVDYLNGNVSIKNLFITNDKGDFALDTIRVSATATNQKNTLLLKSEFLDASLDGKYQLSQLPTALANSIATYYDTNPNGKKIKTDKPHFDFTMNLKNSPIVSQLVPEIKSLEPITLSGKYNAVNDSIVINGSIPKLVYGENTITNAVFEVKTQEQSLEYSVVVDDIQNPKIQLPYTNFSGKIKDNTVDYTLQLKDLKDKERYFIAGTVQATNGNSVLKLDPNKLLLNYKDWTITPENVIQIGQNGIYANAFQLSKGENSITVQSQSEVPNAPIAVDFKNFEIETITSMVEKSDLQMSGKINGNAVIKNSTIKPLFTSDLVLEDFTFKKDTVGTITIKVNNDITNQYQAHIALTGQENQVNLDGIYKAKDSSFDMNLNIEKLNMKSIQGFSMNQLIESTGFFTGHFTLSGTTTQPQLLGKLQFNGIGFKATQLNAKFQSINDAIDFTTDAILLDHFTIKDEKDNNLIVDGKIDSKNFSNLGFDLALDATNFKAINSKAKDNDLFYGELFLDNHLKVKGTLDNPIVSGNIKVNADTKFTLVLPQSDPSIADREGIVEFIDQDHPQIKTTLKAEETINKSEVKGINASVNIEVDKDAEFTIIIDKSSGDYLKLKGEAQLNGGIDPSGKTTLTGKYEFSEGTYEMTFSGLKRKFDIKKGSYILWNGEPTTADINITAVYKLNTAPIDLLQNELGTASESERNTYKEKIPFETELKMNGELMKPDISFDIVLPDNNSVSSTVIKRTQSKLSQLRQDPNELNKQVFAVLLLNHFMGDNPFSSESGSGSVSAMARESASKILSEQLNNLAGNLIKGVELNLNLQSTEDYSSGQRQDKTDLNVVVSKKLLNDRLKVTVGSSFNLEGSEQANQQSNTIAGDVALDYQLSKDGKYKIRGYRINKYQVALQGEVVETGISFIITIDYSKFKELFQKNKTQSTPKPKEKNAKKKSDE
ncbi:translocation/assembly module TamB domain-containing protein [Flavobacterium restrictum]|uniref:Translocation/assembly module TamB n=1 Tax=Flavobacterium restrictum TaxID=2594428 RepID=A0A553ED92_9FLAO|nr:translocation/assembly module TamB domain-containing protein [Flavobacterium restrictum]TRX43017.1 translocation/assembly module TamB [Flavobacterium restrictum]